MKSTISIIGIAVVVVCTLHICQALPTGAPSMACKEMRPFHPATTTSGTAPFVMNLTEKSYKLGSLITGRIYSPTGVKFRGFLIQARKADNSDTTPFGTFIVITNNSHTNCGNGNMQALTHSNNTNKTSMDFKWQAPTRSAGNLHFKLSVVESYHVSRYWLNIYSAVVQDCTLHPSADCNHLTTGAPITDPPSTLPPTTVPGKKIQYDPGCGKQKGCFPDCPDGCDFLVTWQHSTPNGGKVFHFEVQMMLGDMDNIWIAIGLSPTGKMDETNVMACLSENTGVTIQSSHNEGYQNMMYAKKTMGLSYMQGSVADGKFTCSFTREKAMNVSDFIDLKDKMYLLVATGHVVQGIKQQHTHIPVKSSSKVDFTSNSIAGESDSAALLIKLHGSLMVVAWILCSSIGVVAARHCKSMMSNTLLCNVKIWFVIHRTLMVIVLLCVITAVAAIVYEVRGFSNISPEPGKEYTKAHPYLGIAVTTLTIINPIMALFRPSADHKNRPIFNWAHFSVGTTAHITAVVTIFFGINLSTAMVDIYAKYVMFTYAGVFVCVQFMLEVHKRRIHKGTGKLNITSQKKTVNPNTQYVNDYGVLESSVATITHTKCSSFPGLVLLFHSILMLAAATLLVLMICMPSRFPQS